jgi:hypothetical protein
MTPRPTFTTTDVDAMGGVYDRTGNIPQLVHLGGGIVEARFFDPDAPEAARQFHNDGAVQKFISAKKTIFRLIQQAKG